MIIVKLNQVIGDSDILEKEDVFTFQVRLLALSGSGQGMNRECNFPCPALGGAHKALSKLPGCLLPSQLSYVFSVVCRTF
jgi:hypothetical protein